MLVQVGCEFVQTTGVATHAVMQVEPRPDGQFRVTEAGWDAQTASSSWTYIDALGNLCRRMTLPPGRSVTRFHATVELSPDRDDYDLNAIELAPFALPDAVLPFTLPSRFCPSDQLRDIAWSLFGSTPAGWARAEAIHDWVHANVSFAYGATASTATALDVLASRVGVCRDYAHLAVALCRALNIPARYVFGYLPDIDVPPDDAPMDFCAWTEVFLGGRWWTFDPRNGARRAGRVLIGRGRDALDVAMVSTFGTVDLESMTVWADQIQS